MMIKQGDGKTGKIVESAEGEESGICKECGGIFDSKELSASICSVCRSDGLTEDEAPQEDDTEEEAADSDTDE